MAAGLFERFKVIDVDTHLTEPADLWTSRVSAKWGDKVPHIERVDGDDAWFVEDTRLGTPGTVSMAGWPEPIPSHPPTYEEIDPSMYDLRARLEFMDRQGIYAQVVYPNVGGFGAQYFRSLGEPELVVACVQAYNDFLTEWTGADPARLVPVTTVPFWDIDFAMSEIDRCLAKGHRALNFCNQPDAHGMPPLGSAHWDPIWARAQEAGVPISFHIGGGKIAGRPEMMADPIGFQAAFAKQSALLFADNQRCIADLIFGGVCHRFPDLKFVSVESGVGWIPGVLETFDWQWMSSKVTTVHPEYTLLPSEYFRRQIFGCFWFETAGALWAIDQYPDNVLYETDYPHPTCQHPNAYSPSQYPRDYAEKVLGKLDDTQLAKVLHDNAARLYGLD